MSDVDLPQRAKPSRVRSGRFIEFTEMLFGEQIRKEKEG